MINYNNIINKIKLSYKYKKKTTSIIKTKKNYFLLKALVKINVINVVKSNKKYIIFLKHHKNKPIFKNILYLGNVSNLKFISLKNIKTINSSKNWFFLLNTNLGLINNFEAEQKKVGGILVLKLWN